MSENEEKMITSCKGCVFAEKIGITQMSCALDKLAQFQEAGANIVEARDDDEEFFTIDRFCNFYRDEQWGEIFKKSRRQVRKENQVKCGFFVLYGKDDELGELRNTLSSIKEQRRIDASFVVVVNMNSKINTFDLRHLVHEFFDKLYIKFHVVTILEKDASELRAIDIAFEKAVNGYYSTLRCGYKIPDDFLLKIDESLNDDLKPISMIKPIDDLNCLTVQCVLHKFLNGNAIKPLYEKICDFAKETNKEKYVISWKDIE